MLNIIAGSLSVGVTPSTSSYESIATVTVGSGGSASVEFTSISADYTHLQVRGLVQTNRATYGRDVIFARFNGDTGNNYAFHLLQGDGSAPYATGGGTKNKIEIEGAGTSAGGSFGAFVIDILDYKNTNKYKTLRALSGVDHNGTLAGYGGVINLVSGLWQNTNAVTSIKFEDDTGNTLLQYSSFALYGIKGA